MGKEARREGEFLRNYFFIILFFDKYKKGDNWYLFFHFIRAVDKYNVVKATLNDIKSQIKLAIYKHLLPLLPYPPTQF